jgi:hypothetical protein
MMHRMSEQDSDRSRDLDEVRRLLFPGLSPDEGWSRIDRAIKGAADDEHWAAIEEAAKQRELSIDLFERLPRSRKRERE